LGGAAGALARAGLASAWPPNGSWPWTTFAVNLAGTLLLAWLVTRLSERLAPTRLWRPFLGTGLCGALTTFSGFQIETIRLVRDGRPGLAVAYSAVSLAAGMALAAGGSVLARRGRYG
jgi:CrcB protein